MKKIIPIVLFLLLLLHTGGCSRQDFSKMATIDDVANRRIGVYTGTIYDRFVVHRFPSATVLHYNTSSDFVMALITGKADVVMTNLQQARLLMQEHSDIGILSDDILTTPVGIGFNKNNAPLRQRFNTFLKAIKADGTFEVMYKRWFESDITTISMPVFQRPSAGNHLVLGVSVGDLPSAGIIDGRYAGFDVEMIETFAQRENIDLEIISVEFSALITSLKAGKVDMIADCISITPERQEEVDFSDPYMEDRSALIALKKNLAHTGEKKELEEASFVNSVLEGFHGNIIREKRYLLIIGGLKTTVVISLFSVLLGTALGALVCFMRMSSHKGLLFWARSYISIMRGIPVLVLLMIIYYVVFARSNIDGLWVAVLAFGMNFAAYVSEMFRTSIESIDGGQTEAGIAGGFTRVQTFLHIVMPQAVKRVLPVYKGEIISLVKMTSIVGYIAVQDLTKASDVIRSRTFDAFFPLLMTAVLYFAISWTLLLLLEIVERRTDPKKRRRRIEVRQRISPKLNTTGLVSDSISNSPID